MEKRRVSFKGKIKRNAESRKRGSNYILPPRGIDIFIPEIDSKIDMDFMPYLVTIDNHPDKNINDGIAVKGSYWYKLPFKIHRDIGVNREMVVCPTSFGEKCPICELREKIRKEGGSKQEIKSLSVSKRNMYCIIPLNSRDHEKKFHLFEMSDYLFQEKFEDDLQDEPEFDTFPDPVEGCSVKVKFAEGKIETNKFPEPTRFDFEPRRKQYDESILDEVPNLDECLEILSYQELFDKLYEVEVEGRGKGRDHDDDEDERKVELKGRDQDENVERQPRRTRVSRERSKPQPKELTYQDIMSMDFPELDEVIKAKDMNIDASAYGNNEIQVLREDVAYELKLEEENETGELICPFNHVFGRDNDRFDDCEDCKLWNECREEKRKLRRR